MTGLRAFRARREFRSVLVTGASSGIGRALAMEFAARGADLALLGRDAGRLEATARACRLAGGRVRSAALDIRDAAAMAEVLSGFDDDAPFDLVVANAGIGRNREDAAWLRETVEVNVLGVVNTLEPLLPRLVERGRGQIGLMSSLVAFRAFGGPPGYAASKAWVRLYGEALRGRLAGRGIGVSVICPGFVDTPMTSTVPNPPRHMLSAEAAAGIVRDGLERNAPRISFPRAAAWRVWLSAMLPASWTDRAIMRKWREAVAGGTAEHRT
jgi:short-subunit dehydrogenase